MSFWDEFDALCNLLPKLLLLIGLTLTGTTQTVSHTSTTLPHIQISNKVFGTCTRTFLEASSCFSALNIWQGIAWANYTAVCKRGLSIRSVINVGTQARVSEPDSFSNKTSVGFLSMMKSLRLTGARAGRSPASFPTNTSARHNVRQLVGHNDVLPSDSEVSSSISSETECRTASFERERTPELISHYAFIRSRLFRPNSNIQPPRTSSTRTECRK